jgi:hypothetical protein
MKLIRALKKLKAIPFTHSTLLSLLKDYKNPDDKIKQMIKKEEIIRLKRGLYVVSDVYTDMLPSRELVASLLYGPSYVSMDYALSFYGLIPERVHEVTSITIKQVKAYSTPVGRFTYIKSPSCLYSIGLTTQENPDGTFFMLASKEKALCDKLLFSKKLSISSQKAMRHYLEEDLRIELSDLEDFDLDIIKECMQCDYKVKLLDLLHKVIQKEQE